MFSVLTFLPFRDIVPFLKEHIVAVSYQTVAVTVFHVVLSNIHAHVGVFKRAVALLPPHFIDDMSESDRLRSEFGILVCFCD